MPTKAHGNPGCGTFVLPLLDSGLDWDSVQSPFKVRHRELDALRSGRSLQLGAGSSSRGGLHQEWLQGTRHPSHCVRCVWLMSLLHVRCESTPLVHVEHSHHSLTIPCLPDAPAGLKDGRELAPSTRAPRRRRQGSLSARDAGCVSSSGSRRFEGGRAPRRGASASHTRTDLSGKLHVMRACARVCWTYAMINGWIHASRS